MAGNAEPIELSVVMPCLNEAETLGICIEKALRALREGGIVGEVIVADNGSTDGSQEIARGLGARVVDIAQKGYGSALMGGIAAARGEFVLMGDSDDSYDFLAAPEFVRALRAGNDLVMGNRFRGGIKPGAMPPLHRYFGNPLLTGIGRLFFGSPCGDFHCGLRGFRRDAAMRMRLQSTGMEFAGEMVIKATLLKMRIAEIPVTLSPDGRSRPPHLRSWRDGWRNLRFMLLYSPRWLFLYPGIALMLVGALVGLWLLPGPRRIGGVTFDVHTLLYSAMAVLVGFQAVTFGVLTRVFAVTEGLLPEEPGMTRLFRWVKLETGLAVGIVLLVAGVAGSVGSLWVWRGHAFGDLDASRVLRLVIPSVLLLMLGCQVVFTSLFLSVLGLSRTAKLGLYDPEREGPAAAE